MLEMLFNGCERKHLSENGDSKLILYFPPASKPSGIFTEFTGYS